jgi:hypothetical protein
MRTKSALNERKTLKVCFWFLAHLVHLLHHTLEDFAFKRPEYDAIVYQVKRSPTTFFDNALHKQARE